MVFVLVYNTICKGGSSLGEDGALLRRHLHHSWTGRCAIPCQAINISYMMFLWCILYELMGQVTFECSWVNDYERSLILRLFSNMSQWVELGSIMIGWYGHKNRLYLLVHFTNENVKTFVGSFHQ